MNRKQILIDALEERGLNGMADRARDGEYSDFNSPHPLPVTRLVLDLRRAGHDDLAKRAMDG